MIDLDKKYITRDGHPVRILLTDGGGPYSVVGAYKAENDMWFPLSWTKNGQVLAGVEGHHHDLIEEPAAPEPRTFHSALERNELRVSTPQNDPDTAEFASKEFVRVRFGVYTWVFTPDVALDIAEHLTACATYMMEK